MNRPPEITGVVLAGGESRRMGGEDKGLRPFRGRPLAAHAIERLAPQVAEIVVSANRNAPDYERLGHRVVADELGGFAGPLAGIERGLAAARGDLVAVVPCDAPFLPADLVARLHAGLDASGAPAAYAVAGGRAQPVLCLLRRSLHGSLVDFLGSGGRKVDAWLASVGAAPVAFEDEAEAFVNINTREELERMNTPVLSITEASCADDYDPDSMPVAKAREFIRRFLQPMQTTTRVTLHAALGRVLATEVVSPVDVPAHRNSAMDGWAMRGADLAAQGETVLQEIGSSFAGRPFAGTVGPGQCVRIMTGGVVPEGADTVVMQERASAEGKRIAFAPGQKAGQNVRAAGEDLARGTVALKRGRLLRPADLGLLASLGVGEATVFRRLRVAFFSTGDELRPVGTTLGPGEIHDSNRYTIRAMLERLGCEVIDLGVVPDDAGAIERAFREAAAAADAVITSGGVSVGEADFVKDLLAKLGEVVFWKIAMKPGRPFAYGRLGKAHFFGLPGNPVSVMATFYEVVREALLVLMGVDPVTAIPTFPVRCASRLRKAPGRMEFQRGILGREADGSLVVRSTGEQGSGILSSMSQADCFIVLPDSTGNVEPGTMVEVQLLEGIV